MFDCLQSKRDHVHREGSGVPQNRGNGLLFDLIRSKRGVLFIGRGVAYRKTGLHGLPFIHRLLPRSSLHGLFFVHHRPPPASTYDCSSTASPSCLHQLLFIHGLLFIHPPPATVQLALSMGSCSTTPPRATIHLALHRLLFNQPSTGSCSSSPPRGPVHPPVRSIEVLFIQRQRPLLPRGLVHPTPTGNYSSKLPPNNAHCSCRSNID